MLGQPQGWLFIVSIFNFRQWWVVVMKKSSNNMLSGSLLSGILSYTIPIILTSVLQLLFNAADLVVVGRFRGSLTVGAVGATGAITTLIVNLFIGLSIGAGVSVAHAIGSRRTQAQHETIHTVLPAAVISGIFLTVIGVLFSEPLLRMMGTPAQQLPLSALYMKIYFGGITFTMIYNFCAAILRAAGDTKKPLLFLTLSGCINVVLNLLFVVVFNMSVEGVALATVISQAVSAVLVVRALMLRDDDCKLTLSKMHIYKAPLLKILRIGIPAGLQGALFSISNVMIQASINSFGGTVVSANAAAANIDCFVYAILDSFAQTAVNYTAQNVAAGKYERVKKISCLCLVCVSVAGLIAGFAAWFFGPWLLRIYITDSTEAIKYGMIRLSYVCLPYFICGLMDVATGMLRGIGSSITPMILCILGVCGLRILWIATVFRLPAFHSPQSLYFTYPLSWLVTFLLQIVAFVIIFRRYTRQRTMMAQ